MSSPLARLSVRRTLLTFFAGFALALLAPGLIARPVALLARPLVNASAHWLTIDEIRFDHHAFHLSGEISLPLYLVNREALPVIPGQWRQGAIPTLALFITGWVAHALLGGTPRRRFLTFAACLPLLVILASASLAVDAQHAALERLGREIIPNLPLADIPENFANFRALEHRYHTLTRVKAFADAGGRLLLATLIPLIASAIPPLRLGIDRNRRRS